MCRVNFTSSVLIGRRYVGVLISLWLSKGIFFLQDNTAPHKAAITHQKLANFHFKVLKHPAYSPDFAPSDYYLFPNLFIKPKTYQPSPYTVSTSLRYIIFSVSNLVEGKNFVFYKIFIRVDLLFILRSE
jgi:hypothetical protein